MKAKRSILLCLAASLLSTLCWSNDTIPTSKPGKRQAIQEIHSYLNDTVLPVMQRARAALDGSFSEEEQKQLMQIRRKLMKARKEAGDLVLEAGLRPELLKEDSKLIKQKMLHLTLISDRQFKKLRQVVSNHGEDYEMLFDRLGKHHRKWEQEIHRIMLSYVPDSLPRADQAEKHFALKPHYLADFFNPVLFTLWNGERAFRPKVNFKVKKQQGGPAWFKELMMDIKRYSAKNIHPVVREHRANFNEVLNDEEKALIDSVRLKIHAVRKHQKMHAKDSIQRARAEKRIRRITAELRPILEEHESEIKQYIDSINLNKESWNADIARIMFKHMPRDIDSARRKQIRKIVSRHAFHYQRPVQFLLIPVKENDSGESGMNKETGKNSGKKEERNDGKKKQNKDKDSDDDGEEIKADNTVTGIPETPSTDFAFNLAPNPARNEFRISFNLPAADDVVLSLISVDGSMEKLLLKDFMPAGTHSSTHQTADYPAGLYLIKMQLADSEQILKLVLQD